MVLISNRDKYKLEVCYKQLKRKIPLYPFSSLYEIATSMTKDGYDLGKNRFRNIVHKYEKEMGIVTPTRKHVKNVSTGMLFFDLGQATCIFETLSVDNVIDNGKYSPEKLKRELGKRKRLIEKKAEECGIRLDTLE